MKTWQERWVIQQGQYEIPCTCGSVLTTREGGPKVYGQRFYCARCGVLRGISSSMTKGSYYLRGWL